MLGADITHQWWSNVEYIRPIVDNEPPGKRQQPIDGGIDLWLHNSVSTCALDKGSAVSKVRSVAIRAVQRLIGKPALQQGQQDSDFYDRTFDDDEYWRRHYTAVDHYCCWTVLTDRLRRNKSQRLLEIGCGTGQLAAALFDAGIIQDYCGFDFSERRLNQARIACPAWRFEVANAFETHLFDTVDYDSALSTEFLEHVEGDLEALLRLRPGTYFIGTVPNYPYVSHVRHFLNPGQVADRYRAVLDRIDVVPVRLNESGKTLFVLEGVRRDA